MELSTGDLELFQTILNQVELNEPNRVIVFYIFFLFGINNKLSHFEKTQLSQILQVRSY